MTLVQSTTEKIKTKSHWAITIRPAAFEVGRVPNRSQLFQIVHDAAVSISGRVIPAIDARHESIKRGEDWIEFSAEWGSDIQSWRFYQSGQFILLLANRTEWEETPVLRQVPYPSTKTLPLWDALGTFVVIYEFAARLAVSRAGAESMVVRTAIKNLRGAQLVQDNLSKTFLRHYTFPYESFEYPEGKPAPMAREILVANPRQLAAEAGNALFHEFGFNSTVESVIRWQSEL